MPRLLLTWLLLLNYLLVVGAGLVVSRPPEPLFTAAHPYVHSKDCQQHNYLRLDCFERCNGDQSALHRKVPTGTGLHYLAQLKGLDVHCPAAAPLALVAPNTWGNQAPHQRQTAPALPTWANGRDYPPPQRG